ncbi:Phospholipase/carboxylesterase [Phlegmacium glaucopus]|nr:Phospholipase/carboxylesterase [Phlegmacium glaucopus]
MAAATLAVKCLTIPPKAKHTATVVFVHGLGDTGYGWQPVADMFKVDPDLAHVKWVLPHSPVRPVKANMDIEMPSWFDIYSFGFYTDEDEAGMVDSARLINQVITSEIDAGIDATRVVLGGFSQGATMSLMSGLTRERKLAGLAVLSGWLPLRNKFKSYASSTASSIPVFWAHGSADPLVKVQYCKESSDFLVQQLGIPVAKPGDVKGLSYHLYEGVGHTTTPRELDDLKDWIKKVIPKDTK